MPLLYLGSQALGLAVGTKSPPTPEQGWVLEKEISVSEQLLGLLRSIWSGGPGIPQLPPFHLNPLGQS